MKEFSKTLATMTRPFSFVHKTLSEFGFVRPRTHENQLYVTTFADSITQRVYTLAIPTRLLENGHTEVYLGHTRFEAEELPPSRVVEAAICRMKELADYLNQPNKRPHTVETASNGYMATDSYDIRRLGNEMKKMKTNSELKQNGLIPDPIQ
ncbi:hypothetical protein [Paenibacillus chitinolyticus]|uniref:hypothetical protein n=1 Tax=Paenibacillus chitinolyticus TaxID=79263 RepID=UPI001C45B961|nr:hypothetical protein [Paenibacillus chitinolyticus]MBV6717014.1 hypothetical protein [Paenibacillus chitinolyticus]